jgi:tricorn protease
LSRENIAVTYGGSIWVVARAGGDAVRLDDAPGEEQSPAFSPDGRTVAFSKKIGGGYDVFTCELPCRHIVRLTFHPADDVVAGWASPGAVLFTSVRQTGWLRKLYSVPATGGPAAAVALSQAVAASMSPDGTELAYLPRGAISALWPAYRGGMTASLRIKDVRTGALWSTGPDVANDRYPSWGGRTLYFASDRDFATSNLFRSAHGNGRPVRLTNFTQYGVDAVAAYGDDVAFLHDGRLYVRGATGNTRAVALTFPGVQGPGERAMTPQLTESPALTDDGRAAFAARGHVIFFGADHAQADSWKVARGRARGPAFSHDGARIAYFGDDGGEWALDVADVRAPHATTAIPLPAGRGWFQEAAWSPDGRWVAFSDVKYALWLADVTTGAVTSIARSGYVAQSSFMPAWSADSGRLAFSRYGDNRIRRIGIYDVRSKTTSFVTTDAVDARYPVWTGPAALHYVAGASAGLRDAFGMFGIRFGSVVASTLRRVEIVVRASGVSSSQSHVVAVNDSLASEEVRDVGDLRAGGVGKLYALVNRWTDSLGDPAADLYRIDVGTGTYELVTPDVDDVAYSSAGSSLAVRKGGTWSVGTAPGTWAPLVASRPVTVDVGAEWRAMFDEASRLERDLFYDPRFHGHDLAAVRRHYRAFLGSIVTRDDLNALMLEMLRAISVSHVTVSGGDGAAHVTGMRSATLGAEVVRQGASYRITGIVDPSPAFLTRSSRMGAPLHGVNVARYAFLATIGGTDVVADREVYAYTAGLAGKPVAVRLCEDEAHTRCTDVSVTPRHDDEALYEAVWAQKNSAQVGAESHGTLGYVGIPDFGVAGVETFERDLLANVTKRGLIIDQRFNPGGWAADYFVDMLRRKPASYYAFRDARPLPFPVVASGAPKMLLTNYRNTSAADTFAWHFKHSGIGPTFGTRTGGAGVGTWIGASLADGGQVAIPMRAFYNPAGSWDIENHGVEPDGTSEREPQDWFRGRDPQLSAAVANLLSRAGKRRIPAPPAPLTPGRSAH